MGYFHFSVGGLYVVDWIECNQLIPQMGIIGIIYIRGVVEGTLLGSIAGLGFKFAFVKDDGREGGDDGGVYLGLHCFDVHEGKFETDGRGLEVELWIPPLWLAMCTISGQIFQLLAAIAAMSGVYLSIFHCMANYGKQLWQ